MTDDPLSAELQAMQNLATALHGLDADSTRRVLQWAMDRYQLKQPIVPTVATITPTTVAPHTHSHEAESPSAHRESTFHEFADLYDIANPESGVENALIAAYWFQVVQKHAELDSQQLNSALKNLGRPSSNITRDLDSLMTRTPRLVIQVRKDGNTKQARKRYKLTTEGIRTVDRMLTRNGRAEAYSSANASQLEAHDEQ